MRTVRGVVAAMVALAACADHEPHPEEPEPQDRGPVIAADASRGCPSATISGTLELKHGCLVLAGNATLWPAGTTWDQANTAVVVSGGPRLPVGSRVEVTGGVVPPSIASNDSDTAQASIDACVHVIGRGTQLALIGGA
jgi:hypothetical protein